MLFALITALNAETHVIASMLRQCLQIIAFPLYTVPRGLKEVNTQAGVCWRVCVCACLCCAETLVTARITPSLTFFGFCLGSHPKGLI